MCDLGDDGDVEKGKKKKKKKKAALQHNPDMVIELVEVCRQNAEVGHIIASNLLKKMESRSPESLRKAVYHSECRKPFMRAKNSKDKVTATGPPSTSNRRAGRPSASAAP